MHHPEQAPGRPAAVGGSEKALSGGTNVSGHCQCGNLKPETLENTAAGQRAAACPFEGVSILLTWSPAGLSKVSTYARAVSSCDEPKTFNRLHEEVAERWHFLR